MDAAGALPGSLHQAGASILQLLWVLAANSSQLATSLELRLWLNWSLPSHLGSYYRPLFSEAVTD